MALNALIIWLLYLSAVINAGVAGCCTGLALSLPGTLVFICLSYHTRLNILYCKICTMLGWCLFFNCDNWRWFCFSLLFFSFPYFRFLCSLGAPQALLQSCLTFGAFSFIIEGLNKQQTALAQPFRTSVNNVHDGVLPPLALPLPIELKESFLSFYRSVRKWEPKCWCIKLTNNLCFSLSLLKLDKLNRSAFNFFFLDCNTYLLALTTYKEAYSLFVILNVWKLKRLSMYTLFTVFIICRMDLLTKSMCLDYKAGFGFWIMIPHFMEGGRVSTNKYPKI